MGPTPGPRRRGPRRADASGTGPATADGPEPQLEAARKNLRETARLTEHERWLLEQRPPHWG